MKTSQQIQFSRTIWHLCGKILLECFWVTLAPMLDGGVCTLQLCGFDTQRCANEWLNVKRWKEKEERGERESDRDRLVEYVSLAMPKRSFHCNRSANIYKYICTLYKYIFIYRVIWVYTAIYGTHFNVIAYRLCMFSCSSIWLSGWFSNGRVHRTHKISI